MKKLIILLAILASCKKATPPPASSTPTITAIQDYTVSVQCQTACGGTLRMVWDWSTTIPQTDSIYNYTPTTTFTKIVQSDSIRLYFYSTACSSCGPCANQVTLYVNGIVKQSWSNDMGAVWNYIKIN